MFLKPADVGLPVKPAPPRPELRSPNTLSYVATAFLGVVVLADVASLGSTLAVYQLTAPDREWDPDAEQRLETVDHLQTVSFNFYALVFFCSVVAFLLWFRRVRLNAECFGQEGLERSRGWALGVWFVPIANLWMPYGVATDIWRASTLRPRNGTESPAGPAYPYLGIGVWWVLWVGTCLMGRFVGQMAWDTDDLDTYRTILLTSAGSDLLDIAAAVAAAVFVRRLTALQRRAAAALENTTTQPASA
ncbi:DUF4328 domain-containing protein [Streptomyces sp. NPDC097619]|uniref:DUF4328 domain-containing protein n=1 Tax=Streptomyces sp. NPDC097619 TaxID=3157228 RepID=UPI00332BEBEF